MRGRDIFRFAKPVFGVCDRALRLIPLRVADTGLQAVRHVPSYVGLGVRYALLRRAAARCGECVAVFEGAYIRAPESLSVGDDVSIHPLCYIDATGGITIGSSVSIAHNVTILSSTHTRGSGSVPTRDNAELRPTRIGNDVWIGAGARILGGVQIGDHAVVGAQAVVNRDVPAGATVVGVPARVVRQAGSVDGVRSETPRAV